MKRIVISMLMYMMVAGVFVFADDTVSPLPAEVYSTKLTGDQLFQAALLYRNNDFVTAKAFIYEAIARGKDDAMVELAAWYFADKLPLEPGQDHSEEALKWLNLAMERKNARANYYWGLIYSGSNIPGAVRKQKPLSKVENSSSERTHMGRASIREDLPSRYLIYENRMLEAYCYESKCCEP